MEIQVGEFIRTKDGVIAKVTSKDEDNHLIIDRYYDGAKYLTNIDIKENIKSHSFNIIDLIEIEDLVSLIDGDTTAICEVIGTEIRDKNFRKTNEIGVRYMSDEMDIIPLKRIKSIVTKEQFKAMEYEVK